MQVPTIIVLLLATTINANLYSSTSKVEFGDEVVQQPVDVTDPPHALSISTLNKNFWDNIYQNSILNTKTKYNTLAGEKVCFTCPIDRNTFQSLFHQAELASGQTGKVPPRITIAWTTQLSGNRMIFFCRNNTRMTRSPIHLGSDTTSSDGGQLDYTCENDRLCLTNLKHNYPENYQCLVKSYVLPVKLNVIGGGSMVRSEIKNQTKANELQRIKSLLMSRHLLANRRQKRDDSLFFQPFQSFIQLQYVILYFAGDSVKFAYEKEVQVYEKHKFTVKCEVPETNPVSNVNAYIDGKELKLTKLEKKTIDNRMNINTYSFEINATREMNGKSVKCEASMKDIPTELASSIDLRSYISKDYTLSVYYLPSCVHPTRTYRTGINRSITIECPINASNPEVTTYRMIPPSSRTNYELIDNNLETIPKMGRFIVNPKTRHDFGLYECIPRSLAGTTKCDINVELGATPDPPEHCSVQFNTMNNKTYAQFTCKPGFNQGGHSAFLTIYEVNLETNELKISGRVNIDDGNMNQEIPFITPTDRDEYYEFLIMQENNYGNSTAVKLSLGVNNKVKTAHWMERKKTVFIGAGAGLLAFVLFICCCCCLTDMFSQHKSDSACCRCCTPDMDAEDGSTYKKAPMDGDPAGGTLINQPFQGFSSSSNKMGSTGLVNQSQYEYYDNTSTGLLAQHYRSNNRLLKKSSSYEGTNDEDADYSNEEGDEDQEHYMNGSSKRLRNYGTESSEESESTTGSASTDRKSYEQTYVSLKTTGTGPKKISYSENNGMESYTRSLKQTNANNYSTIDSKKFIKTDNGLVYTPLTGGLKKSTEALEDHLDSKYHLEAESNYEDLSVNRHGSTISNTYSHVKKSTHMPVMTNRALFGAMVPSENFKNELNMKIKTFNGPDNNQMENHISTATTSLSSASSCTSNSEMTKDTAIQNYNCRPKMAPLASDLTDSTYSTVPATQATSQSNTNSSNNTYSLLKTTLNVKGASEALEQQLSQSALRKIPTGISAGKPPIIKPKPKTNGNGVTKNSGTFNHSLHNQSTEPLIGNLKETSLNTSPSTSVTDCSSNNLTPQHTNNTMIDDITSASLKRTLNNYQPARPTPNGIQKVTTTFGPTDLIQTSMHVNGNTRTYESTTLNRKNKLNQMSIDEEITAASRRVGVNPASQSRTLERRKIQNSEC